MSVPPVPPRPQQLAHGSAPPVPPLPPDLRQELARDRYAAASPLAAPRPQRFDPSIGQSLDHQTTPAMPTPSFSLSGPISAPATVDDGGWTPWNVARATPLPPTPGPMTIAAAPPPPLPPPSPSSNALTAELPNIRTLLEALPAIQQPQFDPSLKITWARDVLFLADRAHHLHLTLTTQGATIPSLTDPIIGAMPFSALDPELAQMLNVAVPMVLAIAAPFPAGQPHSSSSAPLDPWQAESIYMRAVFSSTGAFPAHIPHNPKSAFRDFETAARSGYAGAWFRLGRDYETFGDLKHARECFERGARLGVESCLYRIGMAHLLGQLSLPANHNTALPILHRAAVLSSLECPQPAYVYALLLLSEFSSITIPSSTFAQLKALTTYPPSTSSAQDPPLIPNGSSPHLESRLHLERSAYLHYPPAQYKLGHAYEFADPPFYFDPLLSVQYYSLASQAGEVEADMALSKWFLCGSTGGAAIATSADDSVGHFEKDEGLALTFAQKASARGLPSGHFAMGYYAEVGIGQQPNLQTAIHYYTLASQLGNADATARLTALQTQSSTVALDKEVHQQRLERTRTQAWRRAEEEAVSPPFEGRTFPRMKEAAKSARRETFMGGLSGVPQLSVPHSATLPVPPPYPNLGAQQQQQTVPHSAGVGEFKRRPQPQSARPQSATTSQGYGTPPVQPLQYQQRPSQQQQQNAGYSQRPGRDPRQVVDLVRKNSVASSFLPLSSAAQSLANTAPPVPPLPPMAPNVTAGRPVSATAPGRPTSAGGGGGRLATSSPHLHHNGRMQSPGRPHSAYNQGGRQTSPGPGRQGKLSIGVEGSVNSPSVPPVPPIPVTAQAQAGGSTPALGTAAMTPGKKHPATFAEMGIQGAKAEDKECVVM